MRKALRNELLKVPVVVWEKKQIDRQAREANLNTSDYIREKLGLTKVRKSRTHRMGMVVENPRGDPDNAVDVEELARELFNGRALGREELLLTMAGARREAKRRLAENA